MKRSEILRLLARRLSNRDVEDIQEAAIDEMKFVQRAVLEKLPSQPWFLEREVILPLPLGEKTVELPEDYNGLMNSGGVWIAPGSVAQDCETLIIDTDLDSLQLNFDIIGKFALEERGIYTTLNTAVFYDSGFIADGNEASCAAI